MVKLRAGGTEDDLSFSSEDFDHEKYGAVAIAAELSTLRLTEQKYSIKPEAFEFFEMTRDHYKLIYSGEIDFAELDADEGCIVGAFTWTADITVKRKKILSQKAAFLIQYEGLLNQDEQYCRLYFSKLSKFACYPYFRAIFAANVASSGLLLPPLPSLKDRMD